MLHCYIIPSSIFQCYDIINLHYLLLRENILWEGTCVIKVYIALIVLDHLTQITHEIHELIV